MLFYALDTKNPTVLKVAQAFQTELALRQGCLAAASNWTAQFVAIPFLPMYRFYVPQLTLVRVLLAQDTTKSREHAADLLKQLYEFVMLKKTLESHLRETHRQQPPAGGCEGEEIAYRLTKMIVMLTDTKRFQVSVFSFQDEEKSEQMRFHCPELHPPSEAGKPEVDCGELVNA